MVGLIEVGEEGLQIRQLRKRPEAGLEYVEAVDLLLLQVLVFGAEELRESQRAWLSAHQDVEVLISEDHCLSPQIPVLAALVDQVGREHERVDLESREVAVVGGEVELVPFLWLQREDIEPDEAHNEAYLPGVLASDVGVEVLDLPAEVRGSYCSS